MKSIILGIERISFKVQPVTDPHYLNDIIIFPKLLIPYLKRYYFNSLLCNTLFIPILVFISINFNFFYSKSFFLTIWFLWLSIFNILLIFPKIILLIKINSFLNDNFDLSRKVWLFVRCNAFLFTGKVSKILFFSYLLGILEFWHLDLNDLEMKAIFYVLTIHFLIQININWITLNKIFDSDFNHEGLSIRNIELLEKYKFCKNNEKMIVCSICCEDFNEGEEIRKLKCRGKHIFHMDCIDKWLNKRNKCPNCNENITSS